jgi:hypothetical protein
MLTLTLTLTDFFIFTQGTKSLITLCQSLTFFLSEMTDIAEYPYTVREYNDLQKMNAKIIKELGLRRRSGDACYKVYIYLYICTYIYINTYVHSCLYMKIHIYIFMYMYIHIYIYMHTYIFIYL